MNNNKRIKIAYIGGGSYNFGWKLFSELAAEEICATINLYDKDKQLSLTNEVIGNNLRDNPRCKSDIVFSCLRYSRGRIKGSGYRLNVDNLRKYR